METNKFCQSCSMPLDPGMRGTEKDGSASAEYCQYCYQKGAFLNPKLTMGEMKNIVKMEMSKRHIGDDLIQKAVDALPHLKRWRHDLVR